MNCKYCNSVNTRKNGTGIFKKTGIRYQKVKCKDCGKEYMQSFDQVEAIKPVIQQKIGMSLNEFRQRHDINFILKNVLQNLNNDLVYEKDDIVKMCKLRPGYPGLNMVLESNEFEIYRGRIAGKIYWSSPKIIEELKSQGLLT
jgi:hypothetical protein